MNINLVKNVINTTAATTCALLIGMNNAWAVSVTFSELQAQFERPAFPATYAANSVTMDLVSGVSQTANIGVLSFDTGGNIEPLSTNNFNSWGFTINGTLFSLSEFDYLSSPVTVVNTNSEYSILIGAGNTKIFDVGTLFTAQPSTLTVTLLASDLVQGDTAVALRDRVSLDITRSAEFLLTTSAVPVPATVWLFGSGLIGLISVARRKKA